MKKLLFFSLLAIPFLLPQAPLTQAHAASRKKVVRKKSDKAVWQSDFQHAVAASKKTGKPLFVDFYTTWCGPCKYMDTVIFKQPPFVSESKNWILVQVDAEHGVGNVQLAAKYKVNAFPTMIFFNPSGAPTGKLLGAQRSKDLLKRMQRERHKALRELAA